MQVSMISKALSLLSLIGQANQPLTFSELVTQSDLSKSTVHRILGILMDEEMVQCHSRMKCYLLGQRAFDILRQAYGGYDLQSLAVDGMMQLQKDTGHNTSIAVIDGDFAVVLRAFDANKSFGGYNRPGLREPLHVCAAGKALVAHMPPPLFEAKFGNYEFLRRTPQTLTTLDGFRNDLAGVRRRGYATCNREEYEYVFGIAAPIFNFVGEVIAAVNLWNTVDETDMSGLEEHAAKLTTVTQEISRLIGGGAVLRGSW
ncbi:IclR family transcriptional regulator [Sedimentitalea sp.]|uniref:IclR family transcriptional regulator n=1 Tax=Sedimentitalea sp. TaxID=2048915 RepID=UPI00329A1F1A